MNGQRTARASFQAAQASKEAVEETRQAEEKIEMNRAKFNSRVSSRVTSPVNSRVTKSFLQVLVWCVVVALSAGVALAAQDPAGQNADSQNAGQAAATASGQRTDGQIEMDVVHALDASQPLKNDLITAATIQSEVTLAGTVATDASKKLAESIVSQVPGVTKVHNNLKVGDPQQAQEAMNLPSMDESDAGQAQGGQQYPQQGQPAGEGGQPGNGQPGNDQQGQGPMPPPQGYPQQQYPQQGQYPNQGQYPQQGQNSTPYPQGRPQYGGQSPYPPQGPEGPQGPQQGYNDQPAYEPASGPVTVPQGTMLQLRTSEPLTSKRAQDGQPVQFTLIRDVTYGGVLAIPRGATVRGVVTEVRQTGRGDLGGSSSLALTLTSLDLGGRTYPLTSDLFKVKGPNKAGRTVGSALTGGLLGTIIGCAAGGGTGCAIGAGAGVAAGTAASAASSGPGVW
ncbi:MAG: BON domain-containing protein, partial [Bryobacteraceae bacterium]